jgi:protein-S-isoprenylcysteine O-methyltransferase Ste14
MVSEATDVQAPAGEPEILEDQEYNPTAREIFATIRRPEIYLNLPIHLCILIPASVLIAVLSRRADRAFGWQPLPPAYPWNVVLFALLFLGGLLLVWWSYGYLMLKGEGSPASHLGGTTRLVTSGIFSVIRHPSVVGKLMGIVGLGFLFRSPFFTCIVIPFLLLYSIITNRYLQERYCEEKFGEAWRAYCREVPMLIPRPRRVWRLLTQRRQRPAAAAARGPRRSFFPGDTSRRSYREFQLYMLMLGGIFVVIAILIILLT